MCAHACQHNVQGERNPHAQLICSLATDCAEPPFAISPAVLHPPPMGGPDPFLRGFTEPTQHSFVVGSGRSRFRDRSMNPPDEGNDEQHAEGGSDPRVVLAVVLLLSPAVLNDPVVKQLLPMPPIWTGRPGHLVAVDCKTLPRLPTVQALRRLLTCTRPSSAFRALQSHSRNPRCRWTVPSVRATATCAG